MNLEKSNYKTGFALALIGLLLRVWYSSRLSKWNEEVQLVSGEVILVRRTVKTAGQKIIYNQICTGLAVMFKSDANETLYTKNFQSGQLGITLDDGDAITFDVSRHFHWARTRFANPSAGKDSKSKVTGRARRCWSLQIIGGACGTHAYVKRHAGIRL